MTDEEVKGFRARLSALEAGEDVRLNPDELRTLCADADREAEQGNGFCCRWRLGEAARRAIPMMLNALEALHYRVMELEQDAPPEENGR